mmetsp:Transcript_22120/g.45106  ORF Transcript_22120/g.45106 Transcript_22120/m.45106 type:complete len:98 (+) Transcript_22120:645-938(+)
MAPEVWKGDYSEKSDVYAFSVVLAVLFGGPLPTLSEAVLGCIRTRGSEQTLRLGENTPPAVRDVIVSARLHQPDLRPRFVRICDDFTALLPASVAQA